MTKTRTARTARTTKRSGAAKGVRPVKKARAAKKAAAAKKAYPAFYRYARPARETGSASPGNELQAVSRGPDALTSLRRFLKKYTPANEEYEDGFQRNRVRAARFELMRLEYLHGHVAAGDKLLALLQDVDGE